MINRIVFILIIFANSLILSGQNIELYGGANKNIFHDYEEQYVHYESKYKSDYGFSSGIGIDSIKIDWLTFRFTLQLDKYGGKLDVTSGGLGGGSTTIANIDKSVISVGIFPINFKIIKRIDINFGLVISELIDESFDGTISGWQMDKPNWSYKLQDRYKKFSSATYFGLQGRIAYDFKLSESFWISPQYLYYFGLSNEFKEFPEDTKSIRHYICIGIKKKIK